MTDRTCSLQSYNVVIGINIYKVYQILLYVKNKKINNIHLVNKVPVKTKINFDFVVISGFALYIVIGAFCE